MENSNSIHFTGELLKALEATRCGNVVSLVHDNEYDQLTIDLGPLEIPQYPANVVNKVERICIYSIDNGVPKVFCRQDFPEVPHMNIEQDGRKTLCLFDISYCEIQYMFNASMFLSRIIYWFEQTARGSLHQPDQPLEPFFPWVQDGIILNFCNDCPFVRLKELNTPRGKLLQEIPIEDASAGQIYTFISVPIKKIFSENIIRKMPTTLGEIDNMFEEPIIEMVRKRVADIWAIKQTNYYEQFFMQSERKLRACMVLVALSISLSREEGSACEKYHYKVFRVAGNFQTLYEAFGFGKNDKGKLIKKHGETAADLSIIPYELIVAFNRKLAGTQNDKAGENNNSFVQIGLGALGSQLANNCIRSGFGYWTYIDPDILYPHNLARHSLSATDVGNNKAQAMQSFSNGLLFDKEKSVKKAMPIDVLDISQQEAIITEIAKANMVVDCSASISVERHLSHKLAGQTRSVSFFMNPTGTSLVMLLENSARSITLDMLEMQYYRALIRNEELNNHLQFEQRVLYATSCRGTSLVYPQDNATIFSGICSKALKSVQGKDDAEIAIWTIEDLSLKKYSESGEQFHSFMCCDWKIQVSNSLASRLFEKRKRKLPNETGGVLLGSFDFAHKICYIVDDICSPSDSSEYPTAYIRGSSKLYENVCRVERITVGNLGYIGEWHSHPNNMTAPSSDDRFLLHSIAEYAFSQGSPGCMLIVGEGNLSAFLEYL